MRVYTNRRAHTQTQYIASYMASKPVWEHVVRQDEGLRKRHALSPKPRQAELSCVKSRRVEGGGWRRVESVELRLGIVYYTISYKRHARSGRRRRRRWRRLRRCRHLFHLICNINIKAKLWNNRQTDADSDVDFDLDWNATGPATTANTIVGIFSTK